MGLDQAAEQALRSFLSGPVPPGGTQAWNERTAGFPSTIVPMLLQVLRDGGEGERHASVLTLRLLGNEAWGEGYGKDLRYRVRLGGETEWRIIVPTIKPDPP